ncbi:ATP-dependent nuclease [Brevibacillus sp. NRS-1366]|uniref:ATP-dependent nuclease n=1 Tax=Brevibacillus sp. NRS-1366 TaxID=3233899 RepID=UPI003D193EDB
MVILLNKVLLNNFRNYCNVEVNFNNKSLIIGANDVGKTNLIDAIRLLLDKTLSESDIEPTDEDFCAINASLNFSVILHFTDVEEDCVTAKLGEHISEETKELYLGYFGFRESPGGKKKYAIKAGPSVDELIDIPSRHYLKVLNLKYVGANRQIDSFLRSHKNKLLETLKKGRDDKQVEADQKNLQDAIDLMSDVQGSLDKLSYIQKAGTLLNEELQKLSEHHVSQEIKLGVDLPQENDLLKKVQLLSYINEMSIQLGGDGRKNQAFIALWAALNTVEKNNGKPEEVSIFCIEEPEAHLHPHQQRTLSEYLVRDLDSQVILTSHSPFITAEFDPNSIIRLYTIEDKTSEVAQKGTSNVIAESIKNLEFRSSVISSEVFFSDCVFLVEGSSEVIFYKGLAAQLGIDLDKLNISILSVEGVGFKRYIELFDRLEIPWVVRTDNDYFKVVVMKKRKKVDEYFRLAGIQRAIGLLLLKYRLRNDTKIGDVIKSIQPEVHELKEIRDPSKEFREKMYQKYYPLLEEHGIFVAEIGLEEDLFYTSSQVKNEIREELKLPEEDYSDEEVIEGMKKKKSTFMYYFVDNHLASLSDIEGYDLAKPLLHCKEIIERLRHV